jgi:hypothetical protein
MTETQLQARCFQWAHNTYPQIRGCLFSVPNGGTRHAREALTLKATGLTPGIPDLLLVWPILAGFELKTDTGTLSPEQKRIHEIWRAKGIEVHVVRTFDDFQRIISGLFVA